MNKAYFLLVVLTGFALVQGKPVTSEPGNGTESNSTVCSSILPENRQTCQLPFGFASIKTMVLTKKNYCEGVGCCWDDSADPICFDKKSTTSPVPAKKANPELCQKIKKENRLECGHSRINEGDCNDLGCCWDPVKDIDIPLCYHSDKLRQAETSKVQKNDEDEGRILKRNDIQTTNTNQPSVPISGLDAQGRPFCTIPNFKETCGERGITMSQCTDKGCCWVEFAEVSISCFKPAPNTQSTTLKTQPEAPKISNNYPSQVGILSRRPTPPRTNNVYNGCPFGICKHLNPNSQPYMQQQYEMQQNKPTPQQIKQEQESLRQNMQGHRRPLSTAFGSRQNGNPMSMLAPIMLFCTQGRSELCNFAIISMMGNRYSMNYQSVPSGNPNMTSSPSPNLMSPNSPLSQVIKMTCMIDASNPICKVQKLMNPTTAYIPSMSNWMNYFMNKDSLKMPANPDTTSLFAGRINTIKASMSGDYSLDSKCANSAAMKQLMKGHEDKSGYDVRCGGFENPKVILTEEECIAERCCWIDDENSLTLKAVGATPSNMMIYAQIFGLNITQGSNCVKAFSKKEIEQYMMVAAMQPQYSGNNQQATLAVPASLLPILVSEDDENDSDESDDKMSSIMSMMMLQGTDGTSGRMNFPLAMAMSQNQDGEDGSSDFLLPFVLSQMSGQNKGSSTMDPAMLMMLTKNGGMDSAMLPIVLQLANKQNMGSQNSVQSNDVSHSPTGFGMPNNQGGLNIHTMLNLLQNKDDDDSSSSFWPLYAMMSQQGSGLSTNGQGGLDAISLMAMLGKDIDMEAFLPILLSQNMMSTGSSSTQPPADESQIWSDGQTQQDGRQPPSIFPNSQTSTSPSSMSFMTPFLFSMLGNSDKGGDSFSKILPIALAMSSSQGQGQSGNDMGLLQAIMASQSGGDNNALMMHALSNPSVMSQPGMMHILPMVLGNKNNKSDSSALSKLLPIILSQQQGQGGSSSLQQLLPFILPNSGSSADSMLSIILSQAGQSGGLSPSIQSFIPMLLQNSNSDSQIDPIRMQILSSMMSQSSTSGQLNPMLSLLPALTSQSESSDDVSQSLLMNMILNKQMTSSMSPGSEPPQGGVNPFMTHGMGSPFSSPGFPFGGIRSANTPENQEDSTHRDNSTCSYPPGATIPPCEIEFETKEGCEAASCCWDETKVIKCFKSTE